MEVASLFLGLINLVMLFVVLSKLGKISRQIEIPVVKKLTPELKLKPAKNRIQKKAIIPEKEESKSQGNNPRGNGRKNSQRNNRDNDNRNNNGRRRRTKNRYESPGVVMSNQEEKAQGEKASNDTTNQNPAPIAQTKPVAESNSQPAIETKVAAPVQNTEAPVTSGRPALAPRGVDRSAEAPAAPAPQAVSSEAPSTASNDEGDNNRKIRHGRRNHVKKAPVIED